MQEKRVVNLYENSDQLVRASIDKIAVDVINKQKNNNAQIVLLFGASPLVGTTSTAINLAIALAMTGRKTLLVDCDVRKIFKYKKLNKNLDTGLADYLLNSDNTAELNEQSIVYDTNVENLYYIPGGSNVNSSTRIMCSTKMQPLMEALKEHYDYIVCDLPSIAIVPDAQVLFKVADGIILITSPGETLKRQIKDAKRKIAPFMDKYYGMIINKMELKMYKRRYMNYDYYLEDKSGEQKLGGKATKRKYRKKARGNENAQ